MFKKGDWVKIISEPQHTWRVKAVKNDSEIVLMCHPSDYETLYALVKKEEITKHIPDVLWC